VVVAVVAFPGLPVEEEVVQQHIVVSSNIPKVFSK
jgi:hypothetical protein